MSHSALGGYDPDLSLVPLGSSRVVYRPHPWGRDAALRIHDPRFHSLRLGMPFCGVDPNVEGAAAVHPSPRSGRRAAEGRRQGDCGKGRGSAAYAIGKVKLSEGDREGSIGCEQSAQKRESTEKRGRFRSLSPIAVLSSKPGLFGKRSSGAIRDCVLRIRGASYRRRGLR